LPPVIAQTVAEARRAVAGARNQGLTVGLVPTMGALHAGHTILIRAARAETGFVAVSVFVNPTQFAPEEVLGSYPRPFAHDLALCAAVGVDLVFRPEALEMYPPDFHTGVEVHDLQDLLCGLSRPGHFRGVATVVLKLFNIVRPDFAYFGQKDAQQTRIIQQMVRDLNVPVTVRVCPIVRESDGLALSSRNVYLGPEERKQATVLYRALEALSRRVAGGERDAAALVREGSALIAQTAGARLDYVSVVDLETLRPVKNLQGQVLIALAVYVGTTRLIDNVILDVKD
jgi:pantoate--beta-alanine ligase